MKTPIETLRELPATSHRKAYLMGFLAALEAARLLCSQSPWMSGVDLLEKLVQGADSLTEEAERLT